MIDRSKFFWCPLCKCVSYSINCECFGSYCNGGGCDACKPAMDEARKAIGAGNHPPIWWMKIKLLPSLPARWKFSYQLTGRVWPIRNL